MQLCGSLSILWHCLSLGLESKLTFSCGHCWVFQIRWHIECSTFTASSFRIWISTDTFTYWQTLQIHPPPMVLFFVQFSPISLFTAYTFLCVTGQGLAKPPLATGFVPTIESWMNEPFPHVVGRPLVSWLLRQYLKILDLPWVHAETVLEGYAFSLCSVGLEQN